MTLRTAFSAPWLPACALVLALTACGGGGDDNDTPAPSPTPAVTSATCGTAEAEFRQQVLARVNQWRSSGASCGSEGSFGPAAALGWDTRLTTAAAVHSQDMQAHNYFDHTGSDGSTPGERVTAAGYAWQTTGENIAAGYSSAETVVDAWIGSPGHCANLLNPQFTQVGVACVAGDGGNSYRNYWTMELAKPR